MATSARKNRNLVKFCLLTGTVIHLAGLTTYHRFPFLYFISVLVLSAGYYLHLLDKGYCPWRMPTFWGMVFVLSIPIVGLIAGFQKMSTTPAKGQNHGKTDKTRTTIVTLLLAVPIALIFAAMILPAFPDAPQATMKIILIVSCLIELPLFAILVMKKRPGKPDSCEVP